MDPIISKDFRIIYSKIFRVGDGRLFTNVRICDLENKKTVVAKKLCLPKNVDESSALEEFKKRIDKAAVAHADKLIKHLTTRVNPSISFGTYVLLRWDQIDEQAKWAGSEPKKRKQWHEELYPFFGRLDLLNFTVNDLRSAMDKITNRSKSKNAISPEEHRFWILLNDILSYAISENLISTENGKSPIADLASNSQAKLSTIAGEHLARRSMHNNEVERICKYCKSKHKTEDVYTAIIIGLLSGLSIQELCGLNIGDLLTADGVSWLQISRVYKQVKNKLPSLTPLMEDVNSYRCLPCSKTLERLCSEQIKLQNSRGTTDPNAPLFLSDTGTRLTPYMVKATVDKVLSEIGLEGVSLDFRKQTHHLEDDDPAFFKGEILRATAYYYLRELSTLEFDEIEVLMGRKPPSVFARNYVDWNNTRILLRQSILIEQEWHSRIAALSPHEVHNSHQHISFSGATQSDTIIRLESKHGIRGNVEINKKWVQNGTK